VRRLLSEGRRSEADVLCARALEENPLDAQLHHIHALLLSDLGRMQDAVSAARRAVCLEPDFAMAHLALGLLLRRSGQPGPARRGLANASRLLAAFPPGETPVGADGETAGALLALVRGELARLRDGPPGRTA
jgi:chemotaxis protein methyltransferase CheR